MVKIDIVSGFLGAGKTTFIKRLLDSKLKNEKVVLIENEYGEISVDSDLLSDSQIEIKELSQGCICCSLAGDFSKSLNDVISKYNPDRILIEPSGVGKLTDVIIAVKDAGLGDNINSLVCMVDAKKAKMYDKNFGEFFVDQIKTAHTVILSRTDISKEETIAQAVEIVRKHNENAVLVTTPIKELADEDLLKAYEGFDVSLLDGIDLDDDDDDECDDPNCECHHHHHHHDEEECDDPNCECHHHHDHDEEEHHHHHHHHDEDECDDPNCECHHHHHHDEDECDDPNCECHHHDGEHHHHHHGHAAHDVFTSVGFETTKKFDMAQLKKTLDDMAEGKYGVIVRSKGIICGNDNKWYAFNLTPEEVEIAENKAINIGKIVVIGSKIDKDEIKKIF
ncbi:MAG: GTP-binding protein [Acholeplasmatales bacterium]|nr:GTP-binding protein [Acholeplasmatales bacterium]